MSLGDPALVPALTYLFHAVERSLTGAPTLLIIEEAWLALLSTLFASKIRDWLLTARKRNCAVLLVTQSPAQLAASPDAHVLFDSAPTRVLLPNADAASRSNAPLYRDLGLSDHEISLLAAAARWQQLQSGAQQCDDIIDHLWNTPARLCLSYSTASTCHWKR